MDFLSIFLHYFNESALMCFVIIGVCFFVNRYLAVLLFCSLGVVSVVVEVLKLVVSKPRPFFVEGFVPLVIEHEPFKSFPFGHVASIAVVCIVLGFYYRRLILPGVVLVVVMMFTRVYLGLHYPVDVFFSLIISGVLGFVILFLYEGYFVKRFERFTIR